MQPLYTADLAGIWEFTPEVGLAQIGPANSVGTATIRVPGGGWLKQGFDCEAGSYQTRITIPDVGQSLCQGRTATRLELGGRQPLCRLLPGA